MKLPLRKIRVLNLQAAPQVGRPAHISAASGLVMDEHHFYVIADDELGLATFARDGSPGTLVPLLPGQLPIEKKPRKKLKPDWEALIQIDGGLLAVPSGSKSNRVRGVLYKDNETRAVDFSEIYPHLEKEIPELNIEGAVLLKDELILFQRGNGPGHLNALVYLEFKSVLKSMNSNKPIPVTAHRRTQIIKLGSLNNVPLSFTDACVTDSGDLWFLAAAEASESTYLDGQYMGSVIGQLSADGDILFVQPLDCPQKPEGLVVDQKKSEIWIVTDADDADEPSILYLGKLDLK